MPGGPVELAVTIRDRLAKLEPGFGTGFTDLRSPFITSGEVDLEVVVTAVTNIATMGFAVTSEKRLHINSF